MLTTKTEPKKKTKKTAKKPIGRDPVKSSEISKATTLAKRKSGVTRRQLAKTLRVSEARASIILTRVPKIKSAPLGAKAKKACRTLVFKLR